MAYVRTDKFASRASIQLQRQARKLPLFRKLLDLNRQLARAQHRRHLTWVDHDLQRISLALNERGFHQCPLSDLVPDTTQVADTVERLVEQLRSRQAPKGSEYLVASDDQLLDHPELYMCGLSPRLLDLAEHYTGLPVLYMGVSVKREIADGRTVGTRQWHCDPEDENVLKIIVYLNDVDADTGPFECLDVPTTARAKRLTGYLWGSSCDLEPLRDTVPPLHWVTCTGARLTANVCDAARCLHRAAPPTSQDRYSMTFSYLTRRAYFVFAESVELQRKFVARWSQLLSDRQRACLHMS